MFPPKNNLVGCGPMSLLRDYPPQFCGRVLRLRKQLLNANGPISSEPSLHLALGPDLVNKRFRIAHPPYSATTARCLWSLSSLSRTWCTIYKRIGLRMQIWSLATTTLDVRSMSPYPKNGNMFSHLCDQISELAVVGKTSCCSKSIWFLLFFVDMALGIRKLQ